MTWPPLDGVSCIMCGTADQTSYIRAGSRWLCRRDAERLAWNAAELHGLAGLCGLTLDQLREVLTR